MSEGKWFPPEAVTLLYCSVCGKDDRYKHLGPRHEKPGGGRCSGKLLRVRYQFAEVAEREEAGG